MPGKEVEKLNYPEIIQAFNPVIGLAVNVSIQVLSFRCWPGLGLLKSVFLGFGASLLYLVGSDYFLLVESSSRPMDAFLLDLAANVITCGALGYCYFHFINLGETGRRIRIVRELLSADGLTLQELLQLYNTSDMVEIRLARLLNNGQIAEREGKLIIKNQFLLRASQVMVLMKRIILGKTSEFD